MKILILSCNTGGGHNTAAKSIKEVFDAQGDECVIKDALAFGSKQASDLVCDTYVEIVKNEPRLFGDFYELGKKSGEYKLTDRNIHSPIYIINTLYAHSLKKYIQEENFDAVLCTHFFPADAMTHLKKHEKINIPFYYVATDYSCSPMLEETDPEYIFVPHQDCLHFFINRGIPEEKLIVTGIPVGQNFTVTKDKLEARKELGLREDKKILLIMTGSMGFGDTLDMTKDILKSTDSSVNVVVVTGNNKELYDNINNELGKDERLVLLGFTDKIYLYMTACDIFLSKPGGLSSTEALSKCIPIVHTAPIPGCESENVEFFTKHHLSICATDTADASIQAIRLLNDDFLRKQIEAAQKHYKFKNSAKAIVDVIKGKKN